MGRILDFDSHKKTTCLSGEKCGTVTVSVYKNSITGLPFFHVESSNDAVLPISYVIEDTLYLY